MNGKAVWIKGVRKPAGLKAPEVFRRLESIRKNNGGLLKPTAVVEDARPKSSLLHGCFTWDNSVAAEKYREEEARNLIQSVRVIIDENPDAGPRRTYVHVDTAEEGAGYTTTARALSDPEMRAQVLDEAKAGLASWRKRYAELNELSEVFTAIDRALDERKAANA